MRQIYQIIPAEIIEAFGWALFHSLWQGAIIAIILGILLLILNRFSSKTRYLVAYFALSLLLVSFVASFSVSYRHAQEKTELKQKFIYSCGKDQKQN